MCNFEVVLENIGFDQEVSCKILGLKKLAWISGVWSDNLLQNCASEKTRSFLQNLGVPKLAWISSIWSDNLLQICASEKNSFLRNLGVPKISLNIFYLIRQFAANLRIRKKKKFLAKSGGSKKGNLNIFYLIRQFAANLRIRKKQFLAKSWGSKKVPWISSIWSDNLLQNCASEKKEVSCKIWGLKKSNLNIFYLIRLGGKLFLPTRTCVFCSKHFCLRVKLVKETWNTTKVCAENISACGTGGAGKRKPDCGLSSTEGLWASLWIEDTLGYYMKFHGPYSGCQQNFLISSIWSCFNIFYLIRQCAAKLRIRKKEVSCKIWGLKKLTWISSIWSDNLLQNCASEKKKFLAKSRGSKN